MARLFLTILLTVLVGYLTRRQVRFGNQVQMRTVELRESEALLAATARMARVGGWEVDASNHQVSWTEETRRIHAVLPEYEPSWEESILFFHPEDRKFIRRAIRQALLQGEAFDLESRFIAGDGREMWVRVICQPDIVNGRVVKLKGTFQDITERIQAEQALRESEKQYRLIAENTAENITVMDMNLNFTYISPSIFNLRGYTVEEAMAQRLDQVVTPDSLAKALQLFADELGPESGGKVDLNRSITLELEEYCADGSTIWVECSLSFIRDESQEPVAILSVSKDITERKRIEDDIRKSEALLSSIVDAIPDILIRFDREGRYLDIFTQDEDKLHFPRFKMIDKNVADVLSKEISQKIINCVEMALRSNKLQLMEYTLDTPAGILHFEARFKASGENEAIAFVRDITERKRYESQLQYMSLHDKLTGLYNRSYFEEELNRLSGGRDYPITIILADLDGLKLINDTMGHDKGDQILVAAADLIQQSLRTSDILARIGGDEFAMILPQSNAEAGESICCRIRKNIETYNQIHADLPVSISLGIASGTKGESLRDLLKQADELMYQDKLSRSASARNHIVQTLLATLSERDFITEGHARRLIKHCQRVGEKAVLYYKQLSDLALLAQVHDLGKVGVPDRILFKEGPLTEDEWKIMRQHPEKGYRIAISSPDLSSVADLILKHHEHWDGKGYPLGLKGEEIPVECRILAIVDAYDAMTNDRPYKKAVSRETALEELQRHAGSHFDPLLVDLFINTL